MEIDDQGTPVFGNSLFPENNLPFTPINQPLSSHQKLSFTNQTTALFPQYQASSTHQNAYFLNQTTGYESQHQN